MVVSSAENAALLRFLCSFGAFKLSFNDQYNFNFVVSEQRRSVYFKIALYIKINYIYTYIYTHMSSNIPWANVTQQSMAEINLIFFLPPLKVS